MPRFMGFVRMEEGVGTPPQALFDAMDAHVGERAAKGVFLDGGGLYGSVTGRLTIHGQTRSITFPVARVNGRYQGEVAIKQRDFGIEPIRIAGGAVKVKDEMKVQFDIAK